MVTNLFEDLQWRIHCNYCDCPLTPIYNRSLCPLQRKKCGMANCPAVKFA